jgi:endonuclease YncB( thermonuclease family)
MTGTCLSLKGGHGGKGIHVGFTIVRLTMDRNLIIKAVALLCFLLIVVRHGMAADFTGEVIRVLDGDTIEVLHEKNPERIRLDGIDCPEKGQAFGQKAKQATSSLLFGKEVRIESHGRDKHRRTLGTVFDGDLNVNQELVKAGAGGLGSSSRKTTC